MARHRSNPLALAVLACLTERPMHPYEMAATMRTRGQDQSIRLNYGSLYGVVENLLKRGLVEEQEVMREGRRPERTVYRITEEGRTEVGDWMAELLGRAAKEFPQFEAGLSLMGVLPPPRVVELLHERVAALQARLSELDAIVEAATRNGVPRIFLVEMDYERALVDTDCAFTEQLAADIESETLDGVSFWKAVHAAAGTDSEGKQDT
jgi:DNA-binding PadR family transcriptional regulator